MEFNPTNGVIKLRVQNMDMEAKGEPEAASRLSLQSWNEATDELEKSIAARARSTIAGLAVQDGNLADLDPRTGKRVTVEELAA